MSIQNRINTIDRFIQKLDNESNRWTSLAIAIDIADEIMKGIIPEENDWHQKLNHQAQENGVLPKPMPIDTFSTQKQHTWFVGHPTLKSARIALNHFKQDNCPVESHFYWFSDKETKQKISATTQFTSNWEDSDLTRDPVYKVGIDFILTSDTDKFLMILTNNQKLRVMELSGNLSNTQKMIFQNKLFTTPFKYNIEEKLSLHNQIHNTLWDALQLHEVNKEFFKGISVHHDQLVESLMSKNNISHENSKQFSTRLLGRLLFIWFLRKMNFINENVGYFDAIGLNSSDYYKKKLKPLFFQTLNTAIGDRGNTCDNQTPYLNGGLFDIKINDYNDIKLVFPHDFFDTLYTHFNQFNFTVDESSSDYELIAVDPEMLGQVFESLLASQEDNKGKSDRNKTGSFYTPREIVDYMCKESLRQYLYRFIDNPSYNRGLDQLIDLSDADFISKKSTSQVDLWGKSSKIVISKIQKALEKIKIIDPAVGSGAFPIGMLQVITKTYQRISKYGEFDSYQTKLNIVENNIYGIDIQPMAVEIARLRAWLAIIVDQKYNETVKPLPNLEFKFISANSLVPLDKEINLWSNSTLDLELSEIRDKYFNARTKNSKDYWQKKYYNITGSGQTELLDRRSEQLNSFDPFSNTKAANFYDSHFMFGITDGFDVVIGNPPYINFQRMDKKDRDFYKYLNNDTFAARGDIYTLFYELGIKLLKAKGILTYITSNKWMRAGYGKKLRNYLLDHSNPIILIDLGSGVFDHATVDTNIMILTKETNNNNLIATSLGEETSLKENVNINGILTKYSKNELWTILTPLEQSIKQKLENRGTPLKDWDISIQYGIKTGLNDAFVISKEIRDDLISEDSKSAEIIRPLLRGKDIMCMTHKTSQSYIILAYFNSHKLLKGKYPAVYKYLKTYEDRLKERGQVKYKANGKQNNAPYPGQHHWLELDNNPTIKKLNCFSQKKIIFSRISGETPRFSIDEEKHITNDTAYIIIGQDLDYLLQQLTSDIIWFSFNKFYMGGGINKEFKVNNLINLPVPLPGIELNLTNDEIKYIKNYSSNKLL